MIKDATYFVEQIRTNKTTPEYLLLAAKKKIEKINPTYNAIIADDIDKAKRDINETKNGFFSGLPFPLKMLGQTHDGLGATSCSMLFKNNISDADDNFVTTLIKAGLTPFSQTNSPEFGFKNITDSAIYGVTRNVWNPAYYSGGSSGGAASAVAAGIFPMAGASDGGGSIRIPASFSGLIGLKVTRGLMPQGPDNYRGWQGASTSGALTVSVRDTASFLAEMQLMQEADPYQASLLDKDTLHHLTEIDRPLNIAISFDSPISGVKISNTAKAALHKAIDFLKAQGHHITEVDFPLDARALIQSYYQMNAAETFAMLNPWEKQQGKKITNKDVEPLTYALLEAGRHVNAADYIHSLNSWDKACEIFNDELFKNFDLFLTPTTAKTAPKIGETLIDDSLKTQLTTCEKYDLKQQLNLIEAAFELSLTYTPYSFISNLTGQPALSIPVYLDSHTNLPQGVQIWGAKHDEILMLRLALQFENHGQFILPEVYRT